MLSFLGGKPQARDTARELLNQSAKVLRYRRDVIKPAALKEIEDATGALAVLLADKKTPAEAFAEPVAALDKLLRKHGGTMHPLGWAADWTETFVIAAILAGGVRAFLFQPFKIPTNSMYPTFHGQTAKVYADGEPEPSSVQRALRKVTLGATHIAPLSPVSGEVWIPVAYQDKAAHDRFENKTIDNGIFGTGVWKGPADRHYLLVGDTPVPIVTPEEFAFQDAVLACFFPKENAMPVTTKERWEAVKQAAVATNEHRRVDGVQFIRTGRTVKAGEPLMRFDVLTGDMVIVDRVSYNFMKPRVGDAFVFRTRDVPGFHGERDDFYIKRLVGAPGETLQVSNGKLLRNGAVASGNVGFERNNAHDTKAEYYGYTPSIGGEFDLSAELTLPASQYWAMGDNSANSADSRQFGYVPENAIVGKSVFILYPFTNRTGPSK